MPVYEYLCDECLHVTTIICDYKDKPDGFTCGCGGNAEYIVSRFSVGARNISRVHRREIDYDNETVADIHRKQAKIMEGNDGFSQRGNSNQARLMRLMEMPEKKIKDYFHKQHIDRKGLDRKFTKQELGWQ